MKCILVTGASRGLGLQITLQLLSAGCRVFATSSTAPPALLALLARHHGSLAHLEADLADPETPTLIYQKCMRDFGSIHGIVHCAGTIPLAIITASEHSLQRAFTINLLAFTKLVALALPELRKQAAVVIAVSSGASTTPYKGWSSYCMSKAALNMFCACLSIEEPLLRVAAIRPGVIDTAMQKLIREQGSACMDPQMHVRLVEMEKTGLLLDAALPASRIAYAVLHGDSFVNGAFVDWNSINVANEPL